MHPLSECVHMNRRDFLATGASGIGTLALASLLHDDGLLAAPTTVVNPLAPKASHFAPKAKACICIYLEGAPSHLDLFDPKPTLNALHLKKLPESFTKEVRFAFIKKDSAVLVGSPRKFTKHGQCGTEFCDYLPHLATCVDDIAL